MQRTGIAWITLSVLVASGAVFAPGCQRDDGEECSLESGVYEPDDLRETTVIEEQNPDCLSGVCIGAESRTYCSCHCSSDDDCVEGMSCALIDVVEDRSVCVFPNE